MSAKRKGRRKSHERKEALDDTGAANEEVQKDLSALSKEEQMDVLYRKGFSIFVCIVLIFLYFFVFYIFKLNLF